MKKVINITIFVAAIIGVIVLFLLNGLFWWGLVNFILWAFQIDFDFTYIMGVAIGVLLFVIKTSL